MQEAITCPSGLVVEIRNMKAKELAMLTAPEEAFGETKGNGRKQRAAARAAAGVKRDPSIAVLQSCTLHIENQGPYPGTFSWKDALLGDRFFALVRLRVCTWGADYEYKVRCTDTKCEHHKKPFVWAEDLDSLSIQKLPEESRRKVRENDLAFVFTMNGKQAEFQLQKGDPGTEMLPVPKHKELLATVAYRITKLEGFQVDNTDEEKWAQLVDMVGEVDLPELMQIRGLMESVDGGVQTNTLVECPKCGLEFDVAIPFGAQAFLLPDKKTPASPPASTPTP